MKDPFFSVTDSNVKEFKINKVRISRTFGTDREKEMSFRAGATMSEWVMVEPEGGDSGNVRVVGSWWDAEAATRSVWGRVSFTSC